MYHSLQFHVQIKKKINIYWKTSFGCWEFSYVSIGKPFFRFFTIKTLTKDSVVFQRQKKIIIALVYCTSSPFFWKLEMNFKILDVF